MSFTLVARSSLRRLPTSFTTRSISTSSPSVVDPLATSLKPLPKHLLSLADLSIPQINSLISTSLALKSSFYAASRQGNPPPKEYADVLKSKTVAMLFTKRSTRTRVATETSVGALGGKATFLGSADIQLGVNESPLDTARVVGSMVDGIMARVNGHDEVELLARESPAPVINALSDLYHPTQILADLLTLVELYGPSPSASSSSSKTPLDALKGLTVGWVGDSNNILNDMIVSYPRLGIQLNIATPPKYPLDDRVLTAARESSTSPIDGKLKHSTDPLEAVKGADMLTTDTWISMGQEAEKASRLKTFEGYQITEKMAKDGGAKDDWTFLHCLPRKQEEVDDEVFYGKRSHVFRQAENRKWTIMAVALEFWARENAKGL